MVFRNYIIFKRNITSRFTLLSFEVCFSLHNNLDDFVLSKNRIKSFKSKNSCLEKTIISKQQWVYCCVLCSRNEAHLKSEICSVNFIPLSSCGHPDLSEGRGDWQRRNEWKAQPIKPKSSAWKNRWKTVSTNVRHGLRKVAHFIFLSLRGND